MLKALAILFAAGLTAIVSVWFYRCGPGFDGTLAALKLADGSEYNVSQHWNNIGEPYQVSFYMRAPGGDWGWCYIDHQSSRWRDTTLEFDEQKNEVRVFEDGRLMAVLDRNKKEFILHREKESRTVAAPQTENLGPGKFS